MLRHLASANGYFHETATKRRIFARINSGITLMVERQANDMLDYVGSMTLQLRNIALSANAGVLAHLLEMASLECANLQLRAFLSDPGSDQRAA